MSGARRADSASSSGAADDRGRYGVGIAEQVQPYRASLLLGTVNVTTRRAVATARQAASFEVPILVSGESGTGKSVLAFAIHEWSPRREGPFVAMSCRGAEASRADVAAARPETLREDEWRHCAPEGTLFLDEVGMLTGTQQTRLVRFLDEDCAGVQGRPTGWGTRVIAATSRDLERDVRAGRFRYDAFFRLNVVAIHLPPLRKRVEDLPHLVPEILGALCVRHHRAPMRVAPEVYRAFTVYPWPGNVRELVTVLEHATVLAPTSTIEMTDLPDRLLTRVH